MSVYNFSKVALLLCCSSMQARFIALLSRFLPWLQFPSIEQDLLVMARGVLQIAVFIECIWWFAVHCCIIVWLYGFFLFFLSSHCGFHLSFGTHNNHNILIDAFISQLPLASKAILSAFIHTQSTLPSAQSFVHHAARCYSKQVMPPI